MPPSILLIDDKKGLLDELVAAVGAHFPAGGPVIRTWVPTSAEADPLNAFNELVDDDTILVVTDYDLTAQGRTGLFGSAIVGWCQHRGIPVGDYSRGNTGNLAKQSSLFEMRVPSDTDAAGRFIASAFTGFNSIRSQLREATWIDEKRSPAAVLATVLGEPGMESQFSLYEASLGANAALLDQIAPDAGGAALAARRVALLSYIVGHLLLNSVLRFPGPILSTRALAAYVGCDTSDSEVLREQFAGAAYTGPFAELDRFFWLKGVDDILAPLLAQLPAAFSANTSGEWNREALEAKIGRRLARHPCNRCSGVNGGFLCPLTGRTVCERTDCSVGSNSWIPQGARLCRIEREYYDEWAPILGF